MKPFVVLSIVVLCLGIGDAQQATKSDSQIKRELIRQSISRYPGNGPCPYNPLTGSGGYASLADASLQYEPIALQIRVDR